MAEIFLAQLQGAQGFQKLLVLKRIRRSFSSDPQFRKMLVGEAHVAMGLNHGNIVQVLDLGEAAGRDFLALELVDGWSLNELLKRGQAAGLPLPRALALHVTLQVCRALAYAHERRVDGEPQGIVHRDISPQNILVSEHGEVKLTDFGIAKARNRKEKTEKGVVKGKVSFMSPEQALGRTLDARSDLYSLGTVLYLMSTGRHPFQAATELETMVRVQAGEFASPAKLKPRVEPELCKLILRAMATDPSARFRTAEEMLTATEAVLRSAFEPAGQSELKRWLDALHRADGVPPISQLPARASRPDEEDVVERVELTDSDVMPAERAPDLVPPPPPTDRPGARFPAAARPRSRVRRWSAGTLVGLVLLGAGLWTLSRRQRGTSSEPPTVARVDAGGEWPEGPTPPSAVSIASHDAGPAAAAPAVASEPVTPEATDGGGDAEELAATDAARLEATDAGREGAPGGASDAVPQVLVSPAARPRTSDRPGTAASLESASVLISSEPPGATIKLEKRTLGKTPIHLRFRPGRTYELLFALEGYAPQVRVLSVRERPNAQLHVLLKRPGPGTPGKRRK